MCVLSAELVKACKDSVGGIKKIWAVELSAKATLTKAAGEVSALTITGPAVFLGWAFDIEMAQMGATPTRSDENGTVFFQQTLAVKLHKWDLAKSQEIEKISKSDILAIALDNNGVYWLLGEENGLRWSEGAADSGKAFGDFTGFDMGFVGKEKSMPLTVASGVITTLGLT
jgi:hypothetical protein